MRWFSTKQKAAEVLPPAESSAPDPGTMLIQRKDGSVEVMEAKSFSQSYQFFLGTSGNVYAYTRYTMQELIDNFEMVAPLQSAVMRIAEAVGAMPLALENKKTGDLETEHPLLDLLLRPGIDGQKTKRELFRDIAIWKVLSGNAYITTSNSTSLKAPPEAIQALPSQNMTITPDRAGYPLEYDYNCAGLSLSFKRDYLLDRFVTDNNSSDLLHIRNFNARYGMGDLRGMSEAAPLFHEVNQYLAAGQHNLNLLRNGARPSGALIMKPMAGAPAGAMDDVQFDRLKAQIAANRSGMNNAGKPLLLEGNMEWAEMSISPKDMDFVKLKESAEEQIFKTLQVPLELAMGKGTTYANRQEARLEFCENRILPFMEDLLDHLDTFLLPRYKDLKGYRLAVDKGKVELLSTKELERRKTIESSTTLTINEKREELGKPPVKYKGDTIFTATGIAMAGNDKPAQPVPQQATKPPPKPENPDTTTGDGSDAMDLEQTPAATGDDRGDPLLKNMKKITHTVTINPEAINSPASKTAAIALAERMYEDMAEEFGQSAMEDIGARAAFELDASIKKFISEQSGTLIEQINDTTLSAIQSVLSDAHETGDSAVDIAQSIQGLFDNAGESRARLIAMTESTRIAGYASRAAMTQAGIEHAFWLATLDGHTRETHSEMNGQRNDAEGLFHAPDGQSAEHPGGFGDPALDCNCRCALVADVGQNAPGASEDEDDGKAWNDYLTKTWQQKEARRAHAAKSAEKFIRQIFKLQANAVLRQTRP